MPGLPTQTLSSDALGADLNPPLPCEEDVRAQLASILRSPDFAAPPRLRKFLTYIVEETLAGRGARLKGYSIGIEVFGRNPGFDVLGDPVVRIEAGRLRRALERYYLLEGRDAPIIINIPKGGYAPLFQQRHSPSSPTTSLAAETRGAHCGLGLSKDTRQRLLVASATVGGLAIAVWTTTSIMHNPAVTPDFEPRRLKTSILVTPLVSLSPSISSDFPIGLSEELISRLAEIPEVAVFRSETTVAQNQAVPPRRQVDRRAALTFEGTMRSINKRVRITARLVDLDSAFISWSSVFEAEIAEENSIDLEISLAAKIAASVAASTAIRSRSLPVQTERR